MIVNDAINETAEIFSRLLHPLVQALWVDPTHPRDDVEGCIKLRELLQYRNKLVLAFMQTRPESHLINDVLHEAEDQLTDVDCQAGTISNSVEKNLHLVMNRSTGPSSVVAEELHDAELAHLTPEGAVVGKDHVSTIVGEVADSNVGRAAGEVVLHLQDLSSHLQCGDIDTVDASEVEVNNASIVAGEAGQSPVGELVHHQHVSNDKEGVRPLWEANPSMLHCQEEEDRKQEEEEQRCNG